jgi:hypothetical protein
MYLTTVCRWPHAPDLSLQVVRPLEPSLHLLIPNSYRWPHPPYFSLQVATSICRWPHAPCVCRWPHTCIIFRGQNTQSPSACGYIHRLCLQLATRTPHASFCRWLCAPSLHQQVAIPTPPHALCLCLQQVASCTLPLSARGERTSPPSAGGYMHLASVCKPPYSPCLCCR